MPNRALAQPPSNRSAAVSLTSRSNDRILIASNLAKRCAVTELLRLIPLRGTQSRSEGKVKMRPDVYAAPLNARQHFSPRLRSIHEL